MEPREGAAKTFLEEGMLGGRLGECIGVYKAKQKECSRQGTSPCKNMEA